MSRFINPENPDGRFVDVTPKWRDKERFVYAVYETPRNRSDYLVILVDTSISDVDDLALNGKVPNIGHLAIMTFSTYNSLFWAKRWGKRMVKRYNKRQDKNPRRVA